MFDIIPGLYPNCDNQKCLQTFARCSRGGDAALTSSWWQSQQMTALLYADVGKQRLMVTELVSGSTGI